jgi:site-specific recombinase XerD
MNALNVNNSSEALTSNDILNKLSTSFDLIDQLDLTTVDPDVLAKFAQKIANSRVEEKVEREAEKRRFPLGAYVDVWIQRYQSQKTQTAYRKAYEIFKTFLDTRRTHVLDVTSEVADEYLLFLYQMYHHSDKQNHAVTIRHRIWCVSSLYGKLVRDRHVPSNPFHHIKLPKVTVYPKYRVPQKSEVEALLQMLLTWRDASEESDIRKTLRDKAIWQYPMILLFYQYGVRVGIMPTISIHERQKVLYGTSKEKPIVKRGLSKELIKSLRVLPDYPEPFKGFKVDSIRRGIHTTCRQLHKQGIVKYAYSPHDFRHYYAIKEYQKDHDLERVRKELGHKTITTTQQYLRGLGVLGN